MSDIQLYNIGTPCSPVIQGQAGKPFSHQPGPKLKFPDSEDTVNNTCLCKYPYLRYFWIYAKVDKQQKQIQFFTRQFLDSYEEAKKTNKDWLPTYETQQTAGWEWELDSQYIYAGCFPHRADVGIWQKLSIFPYAQQCHEEGQQDDPKIPVHNYSYPSPSYRDKQHSTYTDPETNTTYNTPFRTDTEAPSLLRMLVSSYKCCNGRQGCGRQITEAEDGFTDDPFEYCTATFYVTWNASDTGQIKYNYIGSPEEVYCGKGYYNDRDQIIDCSSAKVRRHRLKTVDISCDQCISLLRSEVYQSTPPKPNCRIFRLYQYLTNDKCVIDRAVLITGKALQSVHPWIVGKGQGLLPIDAHEDALLSVCTEPVSFYRWVKSQDEITQPDPPTQQLLMDTYGYQCQCKDLQHLDDITDISNSRASMDPPCNIPDAPPYKYKLIPDTQKRPVKEFQHTLFDIHILRLNIPQGMQNQSCIPQLTPQKKQDGSLNWQIYESQLTDYQVFQKGLIPLLQKRIDTSEFNVAKAATYWMITRTGCKPEVQEKDKVINGQQLFIDNPDSDCYYYYQVYYIKGNVVTSFNCYKWNNIGKHTEEDILCNYKVGKQNIWLEGYKHPGEQNLQGVLATYTVKSKTKPYCNPRPEPPKRWLKITYIPLVPSCYSDMTDLQYAKSKHWDQKCGWPADWLSFDYDQLDLEKGYNTPKESVFRTGLVNSLQYNNEYVEKDEDGYLTVCKAYWVAITDGSWSKPDQQLQSVNQLKDKCDGPAPDSCGLYTQGNTASIGQDKIPAFKFRDDCRQGYYTVYYSLAVKRSDCKCSTFFPESYGYTHTQDFVIKGQTYKITQGQTIPQSGWIQLDNRVNVYVRHPNKPAKTGLIYISHQHYPIPNINKQLISDQRWKELQEFAGFDIAYRIIYYHCDQNDPYLPPYELFPDAHKKQSRGSCPSLCLQIEVPAGSYGSKGYDTNISNNGMTDDGVDNVSGLLQNCPPQIRNKYLTTQGKYIAYRVTGTYVKGFFTAYRHVQESYPGLYLMDPPVGSVVSVQRINEQNPDCQPSGAYWKGRDGIAQYCCTNIDKIFFNQCRVTPYFGGVLSLKKGAEVIYVALSLQQIGSGVNCNSLYITFDQYPFFCVCDIQQYCRQEGLGNIKRDKDGNIKIDLTTVGYTDSTFTGFTSLFFPSSCYSGQLNCTQIKSLIHTLKVTSTIIVEYKYVYKQTYSCPGEQPGSSGWGSRRLYTMTDMKPSSTYGTLRGNTQKGGTMTMWSLDKDGAVITGSEYTQTEQPASVYIVFKICTDDAKQLKAVQVVASHQVYGGGLGEIRGEGEVSITGSLKDSGEIKLASFSYTKTEQNDWMQGQCSYHSTTTTTVTFTGSITYHIG